MNKELEQEPDWFEGNVEKERGELRNKGLERARLYNVFVDTPRAVELLRHWEETLVEKQTPVESTLQRYAADEAVRDFVRGIKRQIKMAQEEF